MLKMNKATISNVINEVSYKRFEKIEEIKVGRDEEYQEAIIRQTKCYRKLMDLIPKENYDLLLEFENISTYIAFIEAQIMYKHGLKDGFAVSKILGGVSHV